MKTIIVDDEHYAIQNLKDILKLFDLSIEVVDIASSAKEAISKIDLLQPELIFLDVEMPNGSGFDVLEKTNFKEYQVIFITAYSQYAIKALRINALDYITKPIDPDDLMAAISKAQQNVKAKKRPEFDNLIEGNKTGVFDKLGIPTSDGIKYVPIDEVVRLQASSNYTSIHLKKEKSILVSKTLKSFNKTLQDCGFIRVHQSHLVNRKFITEFHRGDGSYLVLSNGEKISVSKSKRALINRSFQRL